MTTELVLLETAGAPMPVAGRGPRGAPGWAITARDLVDDILAGYAYHLNVIPLDARMPDAGALVRAIDIRVPSTNSSSAITFRPHETRSPTRNGNNVPGRASAGKPPRAATACAERSLAFVRGIEVT